MKHSLYLLFSLLLALPLATEAQTRFNGQLWYPKPLPEHTKPKFQSPLAVNRPVRFDLASRTETLLEPATGEKNAEPRQRPGNPGELPTGKIASPELAAGTKSLGPLELVADPTAHPARMNVKLFVKQGGACWECSGALIDSRHVLTAGHCIYDGGWADTVWVVPAFTGDPSGTCVEPYGSIPFGAAIAVEDMLSWTCWTQQDDYECDMGVLFLERPVGALTGWFGFGGSEDYDFYGENVWRNFSYPGEGPYDGNNMYFRSALMSYYYESVTTTNPPSSWDTLYVYHQDQGFKGQSGGGYYYLDWLSNRYVYGVVSHKVPWNLSFTGIAYVHLDQFDQVLDFFNDNTPAAIDLMPLWARTQSDTVAAGAMLDNFNFKVHNYSQPTFSGELKAKLYLSTDNVITTGDTHFSTITVNNMLLSERGTTTVTISGDQPSIPENTPCGEYFIGAILDLADANPGNNATGKWDVDKIRVVNLTVSPDDLTAPTCGGEVAFDLQSCRPWSVQTGASWLVASPSSGISDAQVSLFCLENLSAQPRTAILQVTAGQMVRQVMVHQPGVELEVQPVVVISPDGLPTFANIFSSTCWKAEILDNDDDWLHFTPEQGEGDGLLTFTADLNCQGDEDRDAIIAVTTEDGLFSKNILVLQPADELDDVPDKAIFEWIGGEQTIVVQANLAWTVTYSAFWLSSNLMDGVGTSPLIVSCQPNHGTARLGYVILNSVCGVEKFKVIQKGKDGKKDIVTDPDKIVCSSHGGNRQVGVLSPLPVIVTGAPGWITVGNFGGNPPPASLADASPNLEISALTDTIYHDTLQVAIEPNPTYSWRFGVIELAAGDSTASVIVAQMPKPSSPPNPPVYPDIAGLPPGGETHLAAETGGVKIGETAPGEVGLRVFPNPASGSAQVIFDLPEVQEIRLELLSAAGGQAVLLAEGIFETGTHSLVWQAGSLPPGAYWCRLLTNNGAAMVRVVLI